ncbi:MAG: hypothetical protein WC045_00525 [Patescibacteria group bacterium]
MQSLIEMFIDHLKKDEEGFQELIKTYKRNLRKRDETMEPITVFLPVSVLNQIQNYANLLHGGNANEVVLDMFVVHKMVSTFQICYELPTDTFQPAEDEEEE